ncbi:MAG: M20 family metallopeptidase [Spirochaetales bacterium]|nr:M20 family metallopeptidase [Spirochaetales bacterium]
MEQKVLERYLKDLETLVNIDSGQDCPEGIMEVATFFDRAFKAMGWKTSFVDVGAVAPCFVAMNREAERYDLYITGHMDTVFPKGTAAKRPFSIEGNIAKGPGVCDMKQGLLSTLYAIRAVDMSVLDRLNIIVVFQPDEEIGSPHSRDYLMEVADKSDVCLVMEAAEAEDVPVHCIQRKGIITYSFVFTGKAGHAGSMFTNGSVSAITEMAYWINSIMGLVDKEKETTANIGIVSGGTATNVVAEHAEMAGEIRFELLEEAERANKLIESLYDHAKKAGVKVERTHTRFDPPMKPNLETKTFVEYLDWLAEQEGRSFIVRKRGGLSAANFISSHIAVCVDGMGPSGNGAHGVNEYLSVDSIGPDTDFISRIISNHLAD